MRFVRSIPRLEQGTRATLNEMYILAYAGQDVPLAALMRPEGLDGTLRNIWFYLPDGMVETMSTIEKMYREFNQEIAVTVDGQPYGVKPPGFVAGDCDDAAVLAAAVLLHARRLSLGVGKISFVAARPAKSSQFEHVFVVFDYHGQAVRVDPTAPVDADYTNYEMMQFTF